MFAYWILHVEFLLMFWLHRENLITVKEISLNKNTQTLLLSGFKECMSYVYYLCTQTMSHNIMGIQEQPKRQPQRRKLSRTKDVFIFARIWQHLLIDDVNLSV